MQGQVRLSRRLEHPIPNLPTVDDSSTSMSSLSPSRDEKRPYSNSQALVESQGQGVAKEKGKDREESDKIYRLYVVPL